MNTSTFWELIEITRRTSDGTIDDQSKLLFEQLKAIEPAAIYEFYKVFMDMLWQSFRAELWDAAQIIADGCSEDVFEDFRAWLIGQGKVVFEKVLNDPEDLADIIPSDGIEEALNGRLVSVVIDAYEQKTGNDIPLIGYHKPLVLIGKFTDESQFPKKYPRLFAKFHSH